MISNNAGWPSAGLFGKIRINRPAEPNDTRICGIMNLCGVNRCGKTGSVKQYNASATITNKHDKNK